jgi:hypothetical protein
MGRQSVKDSQWRYHPLPNDGPWSNPLSSPPGGKRVAKGDSEDSGHGSGLLHQSDHHVGLTLPNTRVTKPLPRGCRP